MYNTEIFLYPCEQLGYEVHTWTVQYKPFCEAFSSLSPASPMTVFTLLLPTPLTTTFPICEFTFCVLTVYTNTAVVTLQNTSFIKLALQH